MAITLQVRKSIRIGCLFFLLCIGLLIFFLATTIILSLIPIYLSKSGSDININDGLPSITYQATYSTNFENANNLIITDTSFLSNSLQSQIHLSKSSIVNVLLSKFLPLSSSTLNKRIKKQDSICDYDTSAMTGDRYITQIQITDSKTCRTPFCLEKFNKQIISSVQRYPSLSLPFKLSNGSLITISMVLCKFGVLLPITSTCTDNIQNQDEASIDCGGLQCTRRCNINQTCFISSDCNNNATCVKGICLGESATILAVCQIIKENLSSASQLFYQSDVGYNKTIINYGSTSTLFSVCSVEPGAAIDVAIILKIIGQYRVQFAIKGGGHSLNPGFSSTTSILISMRRFRKVIYHSNNQSVDVGSGLVWDDVYKALEPYNITVIGGRVSGVGVGGLILGGGYSWKTNQYGLSIDNIFEYELVTPNGTIVYVNNDSYPNIFFGLKGGLNNFGIVTNFNMRAVPQTLVYGGLLTYIPQQFAAVTEAMINFQVNNKDPKAQIIASFIIAPGQFILILYVFYDAPIAPNGIFNEFLAISPFGTLQTLTYLLFVQAAPVSSTANFRGRYTTISITNVTTNILEGTINRMLYINSTLGARIGTFLAFSIEPFLSTYLDKSKDGAYPHVASSTPLFPLPMQFGWQLPSDDDVFINEVKSTRDALLQIALDDGQDVGGSKEILYPNYALDGTSLSQMYGNNVARLQNIRKSWDPNNVMYLAGGFKL